MRIFGHGVTEAEVVEGTQSASEDRPGRAGARVAIGRAKSGRYLRIVYVLDEDGEGIFVVTAYELEGNALAAFKRRRRRRRT